MDAALFGFQVAETLDFVWFVFCILLFFVGVGIWTHATYFRKDDDEGR